MSPTKYILGEIAGAGGMGVVHRAVADGQPGSFAIKQLRPELVNETAMVRRFENELRVGRLLQHPNIVRVVDDGDTAAGPPFFAMEWVEGEPLGRRIARGGASSTHEAIAIITRLLDALAYAHDHGVVHGDVKADNVLVAGQGEDLQVTLIDWGLARFLAEPVTIATDFVSGTPGYMSPEVLHGEPPGIPADLYAAGVLLYELLTGVSPFGRGEPADIVERQLYGEIEPPSTLIPGRTLDHRLEVAILHTLAKEPAQRPASARVLADAIALHANAPEVWSPPSEAPSLAVAEFSASAATRDWRPNPSTRRRLAIGTSDARLAVEAALSRDDGNEIAAAYLARASELLSRHQLRESARQLQLAVDTLDLTSDPSAALWPVLLSLAAIHGGLGDRPHARRIAQEARGHAERAHAEIGVRRADALLRRLAH